MAVDAALLTHIPADSIAVGALRVKAFRTTPTWKTLLKQKSLQQHFDRLAAETSFDPRKDLWEVMYSTDGIETLLYARGEFAPLGEEPKLFREGTRRMSHKGMMMLGDDENAVLFLNSSTAIAGHTARLRQLIDERDAKRGAPAGALRPLIDRVPPEAHAWLVVNAQSIPKPEIRAGGPMGNVMQNLPKLLQGVQTVTARLNFADGVALHADAACSDESSARKASDALKGLLGILRFSLPSSQKQTIFPVLDAIQVNQASANTVLTASWTAAQFEEVLQLLPKPQPE